MRFTAQSTDGLKLEPDETDKIWFDDAVPGFGLRIRQSGSRSWIFQYKLGAKTRRLVIGQASAVKLGRAREIAGEHHAKVKLGRDPAGEKRVQVERASPHIRRTGEEVSGPTTRRISARKLSRNRPAPGTARRTAAFPPTRFHRPAHHC